MIPTVVRHTCVVVGNDGAPDQEVLVTDGKHVLSAMPNRQDAPIQVGCKGGGCGVCRVQILDGEYTLKRMSRRFVTEADEAAGYALACRLFPTGDLRVRWDPLPQA